MKGSEIFTSCTAQLQWKAALPVRRWAPLSQKYNGQKRKSDKSNKPHRCHQRRALQHIPEAARAWGDGKCSKKKIAPSPTQHGTHCPTGDPEVTESS